MGEYRTARAFRGALAEGLNIAGIGRVDLGDDERMC